MANEEKLNERIKKVLLKYCPYTENRLDLIDHSPRPQFDIHIYFAENSTQIYFIKGSENGKSGILEDIMENRVVELEEIEELIDYLGSDHKAMVFDEHDKIKKVAEIKFDINWGGEESIKGINCSTIGLKFHFRGNPNVEKKYLYFINKKYFNSNDLVSEWDYTDEIMKNYIDSLDKDGLMYLLNRMREEDLKNLLMPNLRKVFEYVKEDEKVKKYFIGNK